MMNEPYFYEVYKALPTEPVIPNQPPIANVTYAVLSAEGTKVLITPRAGDRIQFDASASYDPDGEIVNYEWDWNSDGEWDKETTDPVTEHSFMEAGTHQVTLRVTDNDGLADETTKTIVVEHKDLIQAEFTFHVVDGALHKIHLDATASIDTMGTIVRYEWDWDGDGIYDTAVQTPEMIHRFEGEGPYQVILTIVDDQGNMASCTKEVAP
jgi:PKD repeat protein